MTDMISKQLNERLSRLVAELYKQHTDRSAPVKMPDGTIRHFTFQMQRIASECGTAGCAIGLDMFLQGIDIRNKEACEPDGIDRLMEDELFLHSSNAIFFGVGEEYRRGPTLNGENLRYVTPGQVADRISQFLVDPAAFERTRKERAQKVRED